MPVAVELLSDLPLFKGLSTIELEEIGSHLVIDEKQAKVHVIKEGDAPGHPIFILMSGSVEVIKHGLDGRDHVISSLAAPSVFGEIEVLARRPAIAGVVSVSPVKVALLRRGVFDEMCSANRPCILKIIKNLATTLSYRLAATDGRLAAYFNSSTPEHRDALSRMRTVLYSSWEPNG